MTQSDMAVWIVDRIEDGIAVLEGLDRSLDVPASWLPAGAREGSVLRIEVASEDSSSRLSINLDLDAREAREAELRELRKSIPEGPDGDLAL